MKTTIISLLLSFSLVGCGAGASPQEPSKMYSVDMGQDKPLAVEGMGASESDKRYDAVAYVVSAIKPGSEAYRAMVGHGLVVVLDGEWTYVVTLKADGMHIDEVVTK